MASLPRTFARVRAFDIACPYCGAVSILSAAAGMRPVHASYKVRPTKDEWNQNTGVWRCRGCKRAYSIGVVIWKHPHMASHPPGDRVPTPAESLGLRGLVVEAPVGTGGRARGNLVVEGAVEEDPVELPRRRVLEDELTDYLEEPDERE